MVPIIPYLSLFAGWLVWQTIQLWPWCRRESHAFRVGTFSAVILITALSAARLHAVETVETAELESQRLAAAWLDSTLDKERAVQVLGNLSTLIMVHRTNATRVIDIGPKSRLAMEREGQTIEDFTAELDRIQPVLTIITLRKGHRKEFKRKVLGWLKDDYIRIRSDPLIFARTREPGAFPAAIGMAYAYDNPFIMRADHLANRGSKYLRGRGPLKLVFKKQIGEKGQALKVERKVKRLPRHKKEALVNTGKGIQKLIN